MDQYDITATAIYSFILGTAIGFFVSRAIF